MKWITREHVEVDRVACPWLIERFVGRVLPLSHLRHLVRGHQEGLGLPIDDLRQDEGEWIVYDAFTRTAGRW
jgi:hypothetical protein